MTTTFKIFEDSYIHMRVKPATVRITGNYKGNAMLFKYEELQQWLDFRKDVIESPRLGYLPVKFLEDKLDYMVNKIDEYVARKGINGKILQFEKLCDKVFENDPVVLSGEMAHMLWFIHIIELIELGKGDYCEIQCESVKNGNVISSINQDEFEELFKNSYCELLDLVMTAKQNKSKLCQVCRKPADKKCPKCYTKYCCSECQNADWKEHKKVCCK